MLTKIIAGRYTKDKDGKNVWIEERRVPLTEEEIVDLTNFQSDCAKYQSDSLAKYLQEKKNTAIDKITMSYLREEKILEKTADSNKIDLLRSEFERKILSINAANSIEEINVLLGK